MARPTSFEELGTYEQQALKIAEIDVNEIISRASTAFIAAASNLLAIAEAEGYTVSRDGEWKVTRAKNEDERAKALAEEQRRWDLYNAWYEDYLAGNEIPDFARFGVERFAKDEGLDAPVWDEPANA